jgi:gamma-glutamyltranspeptidase
VRRTVGAAALLAALLLVPLHSQVGAGLREPAWAPDGKRLAVVYLDRVWTMSADGRDARELVRSDMAQREPAWSHDGRRIAFAADRGDGFDIYTVSARGGSPERVTSLPGDARTPSWAPDGRIVFAYREPGVRQWDLYSVDPGLDVPVPLRLTESQDDEIHPRVSPDGTRVAFASNRDSDEGDYDIWVMRLMPSRAPASARGAATRIARLRGEDAYPAWSPDGGRIAFYAERDGVGSTWVATVEPPPDPAVPFGRVVRERPLDAPVLASRRGGWVAWSPDGRTLAIGEIPEPEPVYNGNPAREATARPPVFGVGTAYQLFTVPAPRPVDEGTRALAPAVGSAPPALTQVFDTVWTTLKRLYYGAGESAARWDALRERYRDEARDARSDRALEEVVDRMIAEQPLIKPAVTSSRAVVVSAHPLASEAGRIALARGGNIVDAAIAVSFALGVVEPDASGIGGDGQAVLYLKGMAAPTVIEYKDQTPRAATLENPRIFRGTRLVGDGPAAANIPGVVAGLDYLYTHYGSGDLTWSELVEPAIRYAEEGFRLDDALPSSIAEGRQFFLKYPAATRIYLPGRRVPKAGDRFVNPDYAETLRAIARDGADTFYRGAIARRIAADMESNGGLITYDDLAQYRAIERAPVSGRYRGHVLYTGGPPIGAGVSLLEALQILGHYDARPGATAATDADYWHHNIEAWKVRDRITRIADPAHWAIDYERHLQRDHAADRFRRIKPDTAARYPDDAEDAAGSAERIGSGTSAFVIADAEGNMIAVTQTLSTWGGSFYVSRGLGFLYNNHLRSNRTMPGTYGHLLPLMRSNTANVPTLVFREQDGERVPRFAVGVAGNAWIPASAYSILTALVDGGMPMQRAIEAPRYLVARDPADPLGTGARIEIEDRFPRAVLQDLSSRGHRFQKIGRKGEVRYGYASGVSVDTAARRVEGGADPRRSHAAVAVTEVQETTQQ